MKTMPTKEGPEMMERRADAAEILTAVTSLCSSVGALKMGLEDLRRAGESQNEELFRRVRDMELQITKMDARLNNGLFAKVEALERCAEYLRQQQNDAKIAVTHGLVGWLTRCGNSIADKAGVIILLTLVVAVGKILSNPSTLTKILEVCR